MRALRSSTAVLLPLVAGLLSLAVWATPPPQRPGGWLGHDLMRYYASFEDLIAGQLARWYCFGRGRLAVSSQEHVWSSVASPPAAMPPLTVPTWLPPDMIRRAAGEAKFGDPVLFDDLQTQVLERLRPHVAPDEFTQRNLHRLIRFDPPPAGWLDYEHKARVVRTVSRRTRGGDLNLWLFRNVDTPTHTIMFFHDLVVRAALAGRDIFTVRSYTAFAIPRFPNGLMVFVGQVHVNEVLVSRKPPAVPIAFAPRPATGDIGSASSGHDPDS
ncbi:uncharacterized protein PFL1_04674 [Pseudozyma flocculosa PF-1]|uniref:Uncharacterized protein n=1 Tax=Pseudozyma flocculosa PF-1 TaxID=1277687 RepID=A0A061H7D3_9BASI|nr:uncharacterized protein PFL1_04674 [Pseudozyma flocculosa PF-1]EPQ27930.1 hypothetical protein PFL1_04674 [Pseudozyma flocculosa PF-1]